MPLNPVPNYPTSLDSLPDPTSSTYVDDDGFELDLLLQKLNAIAEALEAKLGIGATTPDAIHKMLKATPAGTGAWGYYGAVLLGSATGTGSSGVLEFSSINANFGSLLLVGDGRSDTAATQSSVAMTFETSPTAGAYNHQLMFASASTVSGSETLGGSNINAGLVPGASSDANMYGSIEILLPNYANTTRYKTTQGRNTDFRAISSGNLFIRHVAGLYESNSAIDRIRLTLGAGNWTTLSKFWLFGLPGA